MSRHRIAILITTILFAINIQAHVKYNVGMKEHIVLQIHKNNQTKIHFKDIEIREL